MKLREIRTRAEKLRKAGYSYNLISNKTNIPKSTLSYWLRDIPYNPNEETIRRIGKARAASGKAKTRIRQESIQRARVEANDEIGLISERDLFMLGIGLYIGEGAKKSQSIRIINSDVNVIKLAIKWLKLSLGLKNDNFLVRLHLYPDNNVDECLEYWSRRLKLPKSQFGKTQIDGRLNKNKNKRGNLPYGTAHLSVRSTPRKKVGMFLVRKVYAWMEKILGINALQ